MCASAALSARLAALCAAAAATWCDGGDTTPARWAALETHVMGFGWNNPRLRKETLEARAEAVQRGELAVSMGGPMDAELGGAARQNCMAAGFDALAAAPLGARLYDDLATVLYLLPTPAASA